MMGTRKITFTIGKHSSTMSVSRGTPQGGIFAQDDGENMNRARWSSSSALRLRNLKVWFEKSYGVRQLSLIPLYLGIPGREEWLNISTVQISYINIFTDNSTSSGGCGPGVAFPEMSIFNPFILPNQCTVFKILAILKAAETLLSLEIADKIDIDFLTRKDDIRRIFFNDMLVTCVSQSIPNFRACKSQNAVVSNPPLHNKISKNSFSQLSVLFYNYLTGNSFQTLLLKDLCLKFI
uniref:Uncharacterized protein n=1 Tax=Megaselia scalaris TaxID=36166 RepID=T1GE12_MEGSC